MVVTPPEIMKKLVEAGQPLLNVYLMPNKQLFAPGVPLTEENGLKVAYFVAEHYAIENGMTVEEFIFKMMRKYNEESKNPKA